MVSEMLNCEESNLPQQIRVSEGSAIVLGLLQGKLEVAPTTAYLMTYKIGKCTANCGFCPQARNSQSKTDLLSRVCWPIFSTKLVFGAVETAYNNQKFRRICIQALNYPDVFTHLVALAKTIKRQVTLPISVSCQPLNSENLQRLADAGVDRISISVDAATKKLFNKIKGSSAGGPYTWESQFIQLCEALKIFGKEKVSTHLIVGLGETENEIISLIQKCVDIGVVPALFAFTPVHGTTLERKPRPLIETYRRVQLARYLIVNGWTRFNRMCFNGYGCLTDYGVKKETLMWLVETGMPFLTSGCLDCNRPFYNEKPSGPIYNYPRKIRIQEIESIKRQLCLTP